MLSFQLPFRPDEDYSSSRKLVLLQNQCTVPENTNLLQDLFNSMRNLHLILLQEYGIEVRYLFREWERLQLRTSDYKNHRIFTLRCVHKELVTVSIKAIKNILDQVTKQTEDCRPQLASIISVERLRECQDFINKVSEIRFSKARQRQFKQV